MLGCIMLSTFRLTIYHFFFIYYFLLTGPLLFGNCCNSSVYGTERCEGLHKAQVNLFINNHLSHPCFSLLGSDDEAKLSSAAL